MRTYFILVVQRQQSEEIDGSIQRNSTEEEIISWKYYAVMFLSPPYAINILFLELFHKNDIKSAILWPSAKFGSKKKKWEKL
jgi:hypothetical protein